jgi:hypothetical protein
MRNIVMATTLAAGSPAQADVLPAVSTTPPARNCVALDVAGSDFTDGQLMGSVEAGRVFDMERLMVSGPVADVSAGLQVVDGSDLVTPCRPYWEGKSGQGYKLLESWEGRLVEEALNGFQLKLQPTWLRDLSFEDGAQRLVVDTPGNQCTDPETISSGKMAYMELEVTGPNGQKKTAYLSTVGDEWCTDGSVFVATQAFQRDFRRVALGLLTEALTEQVSGQVQVDPER